MKKIIFVCICAAVLTVLGCAYFEVNYLAAAVVLIVISIIPFFASLESAPPEPRVILMVAVMCALSIGSRILFAPLPQIKPICALVIITGICMGARNGFFTGVISAFLSNFYFLQGPFTPFQMLAMGLLGLTAGMLFHGREIRRLVVAGFGLVSVFLLYGGIVDVATVLVFSGELSAGAVLAAYLTALPFNVLNAASTAFFCFVLVRPFQRKIRRLEVKFGLNFVGVPSTPTSPLSRSHGERESSASRRT